jgi:hypothetical protein
MKKKSLIIGTIYRVKPAPGIIADIDAFRLNDSRADSVERRVSTLYLDHNLDYNIQIDYDLSTRTYKMTGTFSPVMPTWSKDGEALFREAVKLLQAKLTA